MPYFLEKLVVFHVCILCPLRHNLYPLGLSLQRACRCSPLWKPMLHKQALKWGARLPSALSSM